MTIYKRGAIWWVEFVKDGVRHRKSCNTTKKAEALAWVKTIDTARRMPTFEEAVEVLKMLYSKPTEGAIPVSTVWDEYLKVAKATGKDGIERLSMMRRKNRVDEFVKWLEDHTPVRTVEFVTGPIAARYAEHLQGRGLKTKTRRNIIGELSAVWNLLEKVSSKIENPWHSLAPRDVDGKVGHAFTEDEEERVLAAAKEVGKDWWAVCTIMRHTGLRYGDVARLRWDAVSGGCITLIPNKTKRHSVCVRIPIIAPIQEALDSLVRRDDYLFPLHASLYGRFALVTKHLAFREVLLKAGIKDLSYTIHSWRHTAATRLAEAGASVDIRKKILGHRSDLMAIRYDHASHLDEMREAMEDAAVR